MTETSISLFSILSGIIGANLLGFIFKKYAFDLTGNTIAGVFGSIFIIKTFGRLGCDPISIMESGYLSINLLVINIFISFIGGFIGIVLAKKINLAMNKR